MPEINYISELKIRESNPTRNWGKKKKKKTIKKKDKRQRKRECALSAKR
jgi:hypothetical protein